MFLAENSFYIWYFVDQLTAIMKTRKINFFQGMAPSEEIVIIKFQFEFTLGIYLELIENSFNDIIIGSFFDIPLLGTDWLKRL